MNRNTWIILAVVVVVLAAAAYFVWGQPAQQPASTGVEQSEDAGAADDAMTGEEETTE
jgi:hypothetical protein